MPVKKHDPVISASELHWTTARCHRLIRPLVSAIQAIRAARDGQGNNQAGFVTTMGDGPNIIAKATKKRTRLDKDNDDDDPDWSMQTHKKRMKRTYLNRSKLRTHLTDLEEEQSCSTYNNKPGEIHISTPLLNRTWTSSNMTSKYHGAGHSSKNPSSRTSQHFAVVKTRPTGRSTDDLHARFLDAFERILLATSASTVYGSLKLSRRGPQSLFSLCLQKIPVLMAEEAKARKQDDPHDPHDVSAEIYAELEDLEPLPGQGWRHLSDVVRAHGVFLIQEAIQASVLRWRTVASLLDLCWKHEAFREGDRLLSTFCSADIQRDAAVPSFSNRLSTPNYEHSGRVDIMLQNMLQKLESDYGNQFRHLTELMSCGKLSVNWLASTACQGIWARIIHSLSNGDEDAVHATAFIISIINHACGLTNSISSETERECVNTIFQQELEPTQNTILSLLSILSSIAIVANDMPTDHESKAVAERIMHLLNLVSNMIMHTTRQNPASKLQCNKRYILSRILVIAVESITSAYGLLSTFMAASGRLGQCLEELAVLNSTLIELGDSNHSAVETISELFCSVSRCIARAGNRSEFESLRIVVDRLSSYSHNSMAYYSAASPTTSKCARRITLLARQLALGTAMKSAQQSPDPMHLAYVEEVEQLIGERPQPGTFKTPARAPTRPVNVNSRFRWEQGLCEWVAATPSTAALKASPAVIVQTTPLYSRRRATVIQLDNVDPFCGVLKEGTGIEMDVENILDKQNAPTGTEPTPPSIFAKSCRQRKDATKRNSISSASATPAAGINYAHDHEEDELSLHTMVLPRGKVARQDRMQRSVIPLVIIPVHQAQNRCGDRAYFEVKPGKATLMRRIILRKTRY